MSQVVDESNEQITHEPRNGVGSSNVSSIQHPEDINKAMDTQPAFLRLPPHIIKRILHLVDPPTFASLSLLNRHWRSMATVDADLYRHQLQQCKPPVNSLDTSLEHQELYKLKKLLASEGRRNLWQAFKYHRTDLTIIAPSTATSSAIPVGEPFRFTFSPHGRLLVAISSSRVFLIDLSSSMPRPIRELQIRRRPIAVEVSEDGQTLALLTTSRRINIYRLVQTSLHRSQSVQLDGPATAIALSPDCTLVAAALEQSISIMSLVARGNPVKERKVASRQMNKLLFSEDGMMLMGTNTYRKHFTTIAVHASPRPLPEEGQEMDQRLDNVWITQPFFPNTFQQCTHAIPLPNMDLGDADKAFAYDAPDETFGLLDLNALRFTLGFNIDGVSSLPSNGKWTMPTVNHAGDLVAVANDKSQVLLFNTQRQAEEPKANGNIREGITRPSTSSTVEKWAQGRIFALPEPFTALQWTSLADESSQRLVGVLPPEQSSSLEEETGHEEHKFDSGRICLLDFSCPLASGCSTELTMEIATHQVEVLDDSNWGLELDVDFVSNQWPSQSPGNSMQKAAMPLGRSVTRAKTDGKQRPPTRLDEDRLRGGESSRAGANTNGSDEPLTIEESHYTFDEPFSPTSPRSASTLQRAATAASRAYRGNRQGNFADSGPILRHMSGRREMPDESDADNWVPPPPPYDRSKETVKANADNHPFRIPAASLIAATPLVVRDTSQPALSSAALPPSHPLPPEPPAESANIPTSELDVATSSPPLQRDIVDHLPAVPPNDDSAGQLDRRVSPPSPPAHTLPVDGYPTRQDSIPREEPEMTSVPDFAPAAHATTIITDTRNEDASALEQSSQVLPNEPAQPQAAPYAVQDQRPITPPSQTSPGPISAWGPASASPNNSFVPNPPVRSFSGPYPTERQLPWETPDIPLSLDSYSPPLETSSASNPPRSSLSPPGSPQSDDPSTSPRRRNTLKRKSQPPPVGMMRDSTGTPSQMFSKPSRSMSGLTLHVHRSASTPQLLDSYGNPVAPQSRAPPPPPPPPPPVDFNLPSAAQVASLNKRRHTLVEEGQPPSPNLPAVQSAPRAAAGARRSIFMDPSAIEDEIRRDPIGSSRVNSLYGMPVASASVDYLVNDPRRHSAFPTTTPSPLSPGGIHHPNRYSSLPAPGAAPPADMRRAPNTFPEDASKAPKKRRWRGLVARGRKWEFADARSYRHYSGVSLENVADAAPAPAVPGRSKKEKVADGKAKGRKCSVM